MGPHNPRLKGVSEYMKNRIKAILINVLVLSVALSIMVILSEIFLRMYEPPALNRHHQQLFAEYNPELGWSLSPGTTARHLTAEYDVTEHINSKGLRGPERAYAKKPGEKRILILGDSFAEGYSVTYDSLFSEVLRRKMAAQGGSDISIVNAGTGGYATDQEFLYFLSEGVRYHPDLTILLVYSNDIIGNTESRYWRGFKPYFRLENGQLVLNNVPVPKPTTENDVKLAFSGSFVNRAKLWLNDNSRLYSLVREFVVNNYRIHLAAIKLGLAQRPPGDGPLIRVPDELKVWSKFYDPTTRQAWKVTKALIRALRDATEQVGSDLLVFYVPISASVYSDQWEATKTRYGFSDDEWNINQVGLELRQFCELEGIGFIDPTEQFISEARRVETQGRLLYFPLDRHWTAEGHQLGGDLLFEYLYGNYRRWFDGPSSVQEGNRGEHGPSG